jgi:hypothetical protein
VGCVSEYLIVAHLLLSECCVEALLSDGRHLLVLLELAYRNSNVQIKMLKFKFKCRSSVANRYVLDDVRFFMFCVLYSHQRPFVCEACRFQGTDSIGNIIKLSLVCLAHIEAIS